MLRPILVGALFVCFAAPAHAGKWRRLQRQGACQAPVAPPAAYPQAPATGQALPASGDFTSWLNAYRASAGLSPVVLDGGMVAVAASNNARQRSHGMGHHVFGHARRQNCGAGGTTAVWSMWAASPAHASALLDPTITRVGIHFDGRFWTFTGY